MMFGGDSPEADLPMANNNASAKMGVFTHCLRKNASILTVVSSVRDDSLLFSKEDPTHE